MSENIIDHAARAHAPFGGSVASRRMNCTGAYFLESQITPEPPSDDATEGTEAHECAEWAINDYLSMRVHGHGTDMPMPVYFSKYQEYANGYVRTIWEKVLFETITGKTYATEQVLTIDKNLGMEGPADFVCIYSDERGRKIGVVVDFKFGFKWVEAAKNDQLAHYSNGLLRFAKDNGINLHAVRAAIYQPRAGGEAYRETTFSIKYLDNWKKKYYKAATTTLIEKKARFKVGEWCHWCRGKALCKAYAADLKAKTKLELVNYKTINLPKVDQLPVDVVVKTVQNADKIEDFIAACKTYARDACLNGDCLPGLKLVEGSGKSRWIDDEGKIIEFLTLRGLNPLRHTLKTITQIKSELKANGYDKQETASLLSQVVEKPTTQILVDEQDPRPAILSGKSLLEKMS